MKHHFDLTDDEFEDQFRQLTLDPTLFTHEAHLRLAWMHIKRYGVEDAIENICSQIKQFDVTHGDGTKFHITMTVAAVKIVHHFIRKSKATSFQDFLYEFPRLRSHFKELLDQHYSQKRIFHSKAREQYLEPDLLPF
jgi:hypothetical protein